MSKRRFGRVRRLPSGRWQARYPGPDGADRPAPQTFGSKSDAEVWLTLKEAEIRRGDWLDPEAGKVRFGDYATSWVNGHVLRLRNLKPFEDGSRVSRGRIERQPRPAFLEVPVQPRNAVGARRRGIGNRRMVTPLDKRVGSLCLRRRGVGAGQHDQAEPETPVLSAVEGQAQRHPHE